jgi:hypothetical protein
MDGWQMHGELERFWLATFCGLFEVHSWQFPGGIEENHEKTQPE